jgi:hypothetical protein
VFADQTRVPWGEGKGRHREEDLAKRVEKGSRIERQASFKRCLVQARY